MRNRIAGALLVGVAGIMIMIFRPLTGLDSSGNLVLAALVVTLGLWIFRPNQLPYTAGCAFLFAGCLVARLEYQAIFSGYFSQAIWMLIPALFFGFVLQKSGLGNRIVFFALKSFHPTYPKIILAWVMIGFALSLLTPAISVRIAIVVPIALSTVKACNLAFGSKESALINLVAWGMTFLPGSGWLTGSLWGPIFVGMFPTELKVLGTSRTWFQGMFLFWLLVTTIYVLIVYYLFKPQKNINLDRNVFKAEYEKLGPPSKNELITGVILSSTFILFSTEPLHGMPMVAIALISFFLLAAFGLITSQDMGSGVNWDLILPLGAALSIPAIVRESGIAGIIAVNLEQLIISRAASPLVFILLLTLGFWLVRFIDVAWGYAFAALIASAMPLLFTMLGIHPILLALVFTIAGNVFFLSYQQPFAMLAESISRGNVWNDHQLFKAGLAYASAVIISLLALMPYWKAIGFIK